MNLSDILRKRPAYSINRLSEIVGADRRTIKKALGNREPDGTGPNGPTYTKHAAVQALCIQRRGGKDPSETVFLRRLIYMLMHGSREALETLLSSEEFHDAMCRYDLAEYREVEPEEITEPIE